MIPNGAEALKANSPVYPGDRRCVACGSPALEPVVDLRPVPVLCNALWPDERQARAAPVGRIDLAVCGSCGLVFNRTFDPAAIQYGPHYENSLHFSTVFQKYIAELADDLGARYRLVGRTVLDVGCGKGDFLRLLCARTGATGLGVDESCSESDEPDIHFVRAPFTADDERMTGQLVCSRHVLEHVTSPVAFAADLRRVVARTEGGALYVEVPNVLYTLRDGGIWDLIYEHHSYFSAVALQGLFSRSGFAVDEVAPAFGGQFLGLHAHCSERAPDRPDEKAIGKIMSWCREFAAVHATTVQKWESHLSAVAENRVVVWGAGSKGITFVNTVRGADRIRHLVDLNPRKHGLFAPRTAQEILPPERLPGLRPDIVLVMNPLYSSEITQRLRALGVPARVEVV